MPNKAGAKRVLQKGNKNLLASQFKKFIGHNKNVLEVGCGTGQLSIYFSIGAHPGFRLPLFDNEQYEDYFISFNQAETAESYLIAGGLISNQTNAVFTNPNQLNLNKIYFSNTYLFIKTKNYILGLEVVTGTGEIVRTGSRMVKDVAGYDLTRLFVGSEGTLGIFTEITTILNPRPRAAKYGVAYFTDLAAASNAVDQVVRLLLLQIVTE